ncbi:response regulator [Stieleria sp. TO1_6]|uniref:response regulator n=1 Tax=Stieleria tagensis TaxID=2956795 RepID=UPI00209B8D5C|nr:response regulator [Stieleria tagensis]MCO8125290.1 response regulator [Stieleria tagensis]
MPNTPTVLVIEDDPVFRRVLRFSIERCGLAVESVTDGEAAFARLMQGGIDFIVTDYQMPGCDGVALLRRLDETVGYTRPAAILCTAKGLELDGVRLRKEFRLEEIMHKPFSPRRLGDVIMGHLKATGRICERLGARRGDQVVAFGRDNFTVNNVAHC